MRTYRASSLGSCTKAQIALQLGYTPLETPDKFEGYFQRGQDHEVECLEAMRADGWLLLDPDPLVSPVDEGQHYIELEVAGAKITGHLDGIGHAVDDSTNRVIEVKRGVFSKWERAHKTGDYPDPLMNRYAWQISVYMAATGLEAVVACVEDGQVKTFGIEVAPFTLEAIAARVEYMERYAREGLLPPECSQADYPCPVAYLHEKAEVEEDDSLDIMVTHYTDLMYESKRYKQTADEQREEIVAYMADRETMESPRSKVTRYTTTRKSYDMDAIDDKLREVDARIVDYMTEKPSESVRITKKEGGGT